MTQDKYFPKLDEKNIKIVARLYAEDPHYFEHLNCPYTQEVIDVFKAGSQTTDFDSVFKEEDIEEVDLESFDSDKIINEINLLWTQLKEQGKNMRTSETASEKNTYFRLSVTLLEKIMALKERAMNQAKMKQFTDSVLRIMDEELNPDQRTAIMQRLNTVLMGD